MHRGMRVIDVDAHYQDDLQDVKEYFDDDDPWKRKFFSGHGKTGEEEIRLPHGHVFPKSMELTPGYRKARTPTRTTEDIKEIMVDLEIDDIVMISNQMLMFNHMASDDKRQAKFSHAYTEYMLDQIVDPDEGIYMMVPIPHVEPEEAVDLIDRVKDERAVVAACFTSGMIEPPLGNRKYDPIYEAAQDIDLPIVFHGGSGDLDNFAVDGFTSSISTRTLGFLWANTGQLCSILAQGVPEKYPDLDFVFLECGIFYIPMMMYRMDAEYLKEPWNAPLLEKRPSEYMKEMYFGTQPMEDPPDKQYFQYVIEMIGGAASLMYASDYPHKDYDEATSISDLPFLSKDDKAKILGENAAEVFGI